MYLNLHSATVDDHKWIPLLCIFQCVIIYVYMEQYFTLFSIVYTQ